ncbi:hypothetical protein, partial [Ensifer sp. YR511]|uniref:hypothetical protein n=1 Tax=Ensifer sp. YR511 TaxID=1855294 RepID=UPI00088DE096
MVNITSEDEPGKGRLSRSARLAKKAAEEIAEASDYREMRSAQKTEKYLEDGSAYETVLRYAQGKSGIKKNNPFTDKVAFDAEKRQLTITKSHFGRTKVVTLSANSDGTGFYLSEIRKTQGSYHSTSKFNEDGELTYLNRAKAGDHYLERWEQDTYGKLVRTRHRYHEGLVPMEDRLVSEGGRDVLVRKESGKTYAKFIVDQDYNLKTTLNRADTGYSEEIKYSDSGRFSDSYVRRLGGLIETDARSTWAPSISRNARSGDRDYIGPPSAVPLYETGRERTRLRVGPYESRVTLNDDQSLASRETRYFPGFSKKESYDFSDQKTVTRKLFGVSFTYQRDLKPHEVDERAQRQVRHEQDQLAWKEKGGEVRTVNGARMQTPAGFDPAAYGMAPAEFGLSGDIPNHRERSVFRYPPNPEWDTALNNLINDMRTMGQARFGPDPEREGLDGMEPLAAFPQAAADQRWGRPTTYGQPPLSYGAIQSPVPSVDPLISGFGAQSGGPGEYGLRTASGTHFDPDREGMEGFG